VLKCTCRPYIQFCSLGECMTIEIDSRLADNYFVTDWPLCRIFLSRDARFPWLILVPRKPGLSEWFDLSPEDLAQLNEEIVRAAARFKAVTGADKINVAALGNMVPQLHIHVVARKESDPAWPGSPWIDGKPKHYSDDEANGFIEELREKL